MELRLGYAAARQANVVDTARHWAAGAVEVLTSPRAWRSLSSPACWRVMWTGQRLRRRARLVGV